MLTTPLIILGNNAPLQSSRLAGAAQHPARPFALRTLRSILADAGSRLLRAVLFVVMPFQGTEFAPPRHLAQTMALLRRAAELEQTDPDAAIELRWMAISYC